MSELNQQRRDAMPVFQRAMPVASVNAETRSVVVEWTRGAPVRRYDWRFDRFYQEELGLKSGQIRMERLESGRAPLLDSHSQWELRSVIGVVQRAYEESGKKLAEVRFSKRDEVQPIFQDVQDGILGNVSVGYRVYKMEMYPPTEPNGDWRYVATDWEPMELSLVAVGADPGAGVRTAEEATKDGRPSFPCEFIEVAAQRGGESENIPAAAAAGSTSNTTRKEPQMTQAVGQPAAPAADPNAGNNEAAIRAAQDAAKQERDRVCEIRSRCGAAGLERAFEDKLIADGVPLVDALRAIVDEAAKKQGGTPNSTRAEIIEDERIKFRTAVSSAIAHRINPREKLPDNGAGEFRYMSLSRLAEETLIREGHKVRSLPKMEIVTRALHSTSDFPNILLDAANKRLRQAYQENIPSYTRWARRAPNAPDFKTINVIQLSNAPDLQQVIEGGEFKSGSMSDGKETYQVFTYGRIIGISRQAIVNDDMSALDRAPIALANAGRRLENRTVYGILSGTGTMSDTGQLFNVTAVTTAGGHANYATGTGSALSLTSLATSRAAMRIQKGYQSEELNLAPSYLIVPAALEQSAYQFTSSQYVPAAPANVNEFRAGGRTALEPIVEAYLDGTTNGTTAWYLAADSGQIDTIEYCYLDGAEGMYMETQIGFDVDGIRLKGRLDFASAAIDWRGLYKNKGS